MSALQIRTVEAIRASAVREFVQWVATGRAYNGSDHPHAQSLYNECLNAVLPEWAEEFLTATPDVGGEESR